MGRPTRRKAQEFLADPPQSELFWSVVEYCLDAGHHGLSDKPGLLKLNLTTAWAVWINGHSEEVDDIPAFSMLFWCRGLPAGLVDPRGGTMAALGMEAQALAAVREARKRLKKGVKS